MHVPRPGSAWALVLTLGLAGGSLAATERHAPADGRAQALSLDQLRLRDTDGRVWTADDLRGRVTLIDVWATWCAPCLTELPYLKRARARYGREDFEILGVSFDVSDRRTFVSWLNRHRVDWPQVFDGRGRQGPAARQLRAVAVPTSYLIDRQGRVVGANLRGERLLAAIDVAVGRGRAPSPLPARSRGPSGRR
jgi:thiol-disulfide isomerase/thioredoxin